MPTAKPCSSGTLDAMKSRKGNDSLDSFIRQAIVREPVIPFTRTVDSSVQWIQLLNALDHPDLPGYPMVTPIKVPMQKCDKCSQEFCSPLNYRRHIRVHRRSLKVNKDCDKYRDLLASFWNKISLEQAKEVVSFTNVMFKEIPGSSLISALESSVHKPGIWTLPPIYVTAGNALLDIVRAKSSRLPISAQELFSILDDASERTFLCAGTAESVHKYVFDGETAKNCLELKNLVACTSFFFELQLVKAWIADKDAEALRCQKLLVEEEENAQKRQAAVLEKKRRKKLRHKEQKAKEQFNGCSVDAVDGPSSVEPSGPSSQSDTSSNQPDMPINLDSFSEPTQPEIRKSNEDDMEAQFNTNNEHINQGDDFQTPDLQTDGRNGTRFSATVGRQAPKSQRGIRVQSKFESSHRLNPSKDPNLQNRTKIWTKKLKTCTDMENPKPRLCQRETEENNREVIIGSISVTLDNSIARYKAPDKNNASEKLTKANNQVQSGTNNRVSPKHWRPVRHGETKSIRLLGGDNEGFEGVAITKNFTDRVMSTDERSEQSRSVDIDFDNRKKQNHDFFSNEDGRQGYVPFTTAAAKEFLAQRWKEAISADHVTLVLSEPNVLDLHENNIDRKIQIKISDKPEKGVKVKYTPEQKAGA